MIFTKEILENLYIIQRINSLEIAKQYNCVSSTVLRSLKKYDIKVRSVSESLMGKFTGKKNPNYKDGSRIKKCDFCLDCGISVTLSITGYCKKCVHKHINRCNYKNLTDREYFCTICNIEISYNNKSGICVPCKSNLIEKPKCSDCHKQISKHGCKFCWECYLKPENNVHFQGGISFLLYSNKFTKDLKLEIRTRDNFTCQKCFKIEQQEFKNMNRALSIHHIDYNKQNCDKNNLITTCSSCNIIANANRDYWFAYYTYIM